MTLNDLAAEFSAIYITNRLRPTTARGYAVNLRLHILPVLGERDIQTLSPNDLDELTERLKVSLSNKSIIYAHATTRKMLNWAVKRGYIDRNPYNSFDLPRIERYAYRTLTFEQMRRLLSFVSGTSLEIPVTLAVCYGLRRGECLGIRPFDDLDIGAGVLHIQRTRTSEHGKEIVTPCKTENSNRRILLAPEHTRMLQNAPPNPSGYVCPLSPFSLHTRFKTTLQAARLPSIRFHDLRHTYATFMLSQGINPKIVCGVLGHSSVSVTLDIYSHPDIHCQNVCLSALEGLKSP